MLLPQLPAVVMRDEVCIGIPQPLEQELMGGRVHIRGAPTGW